MVMYKRSLEALINTPQIYKEVGRGVSLISSLGRLITHTILHHVFQQELTQVVQPM